MSHFNDLSPAQAERLALLAEECGECIQAIGKILRHGYESRHPEGDHAGATNRQRLEEEIGDVEAAITMMVWAGDIGKEPVLRAARDKWKRVQKYLHHQARGAAAPQTLPCGCNTGPCVATADGEVGT